MKSISTEREDRTCIVRIGIGLVLFTLLLVQLQGCERTIRSIILEQDYLFHPNTDDFIPLRLNSFVSSVASENSKVEELSFNFTTDRKGCIPSRVSTNLFVPIFMVTRDRVESLRQSIDSYDRTFGSPYEIIILDHQSTYPPMLEYLRMLQTERNITVQTLHQSAWPDVVKEADGLIRDYLTAHPHAEYFVVTDPDIAFQGTAPDILLYYAALLSSCSNVRLVGPMLKISDIPDHYQRKYASHTLLEWESRFWKTVPSTATWKGLDYHFAENFIDTTFAMRRRHQHFFRMPCPGCVRTYAPYAAVHLDWYHDTNHLPPDKKYYLEHAQKGVNNW